MSKKYIKQVDSNNFVYPNYGLKEYDTEIIHDINNNSVSGTVTNFSATTVSYSSITFTFNYSWASNGAETFINQAGNLVLLSVTMMTPDLTFFSPFRTVHVVSTGTTGTTTTSGSTSFTVTPSDFQQSVFVNGVYNFEIRMVGHRAVLPICQGYTISTIVQPTPTPTPTPTVTPSNRTPTPTPTPSPTPINSQSGATLNVTDGGWIKFTNFSGNTEYKFISTTGTYTLTDCAVCSTILPGFPFADVAVFTVTNCGTSCGASPVPSPTPTPSSNNFNYYDMDIYSCQPCNDLGYQVIGRTTATLSINTWYTNGDGNAYYITGTNSGPAYDVDMTGAVSGPSCNYVCTI